MNYYLLLSNYSAVCTLNTSTTGLKTVAATSAINSVAVISQFYTTPLTTSTINRPVNHSEVVATDFSSDIISKQGVLNMSGGNSRSTGQQGQHCVDDNVDHKIIECCLYHKCKRLRAGEGCRDYPGLGVNSRFSGVDNKNHASEYTQQIHNGQKQPNIVHSHVNGHVLLNSDTGLNAGGGYERYPLLDSTPRSPDRGENSGYHNRGGVSLGSGDLAVHHGGVTQHRPYKAIPKSDDLIGREKRDMVCEELLSHGSHTNHTLLPSNVSQHSEACADHGHISKGFLKASVEQATQTTSGLRDHETINAAIKLSKRIQFNGDSNWRAFILKYKRYASVCQWTHDEMRDNLLWCLGGKACDFYINTVAINSNISFDDVVTKLEKRFHFPVLEEMALLQLENSEQLPHESLEDWAGRVLQMAQNAYKSLPIHYFNHRCMLRFCYGLVDKEAAQKVLVMRPNDIEDALDKIKFFQFTRAAMYGVDTDQSRENDCQTQPDKRLARLEKQIQCLTKELCNITSLSFKMQYNQQLNNNMCYLCKERGHFKRNCPQKRQRSNS